MRELKRVRFRGVFFTVLSLGACDAPMVFEADSVSVIDRLDC